MRVSYIMKKGKSIWKPVTDRTSNKKHFGGNSKTGSTTWFTPKWLIDLLGPFNLDPCTDAKRPFNTANRHFTIKDNGLIMPWGTGRVWCNPPYDNIGPWLKRCEQHMNAIALIFNRTETDFFNTHVWYGAYAVNFLPQRIKFIDAKGKVGKGGPGAGSVLIAYNAETAKLIQRVPGFYLPLHDIRKKLKIAKI